MDLTHLLPDWTSLLLIPGLVVGFTVHELAHAYVAYWWGDISQRVRGRISFNPLRHIFWLGMITFLLFGFGWSKPVRMELDKLRHRYWGLLAVALSGSVANILLAMAYSMITLMMAATVALFNDRDAFEVLSLITWESTAEANVAAVAAAFTGYVVYTNLALAFFNLLPLPGLDGFYVLAGLYGLTRRASGSYATTVDERRANVTYQNRGTTSQVGRQLAHIHFERGAAYHAEGHYEDAIARYRQAIASDPHYGPAYINLGLAYLAAGQRDHAIQAFRGAIRMAADEASRQQAWQQLYQLSRYRPLNELQATNPVEPTRPWTKVEPGIDWQTTRTAVFILLGLAMGLYVGLTLVLIRFL
ncbi:MAG: tetratricopeptide repeat protein [Anaerolineae bacterium]|nr:tetratricopeptide repeat protein [Anaerolineae bacterium]